MRQRKKFHKKVCVANKVYSGKVHCAELFENRGQYLLVQIDFPKVFQPPAAG